MKRRWLAHALMASCILNLVLVALLFVVMLTERSALHFSPCRPQNWQRIATPLAAEEYARLKSLSYEQLLPLLNDRTSLRAGYRMRDVVLGILVTQHDLDLTRALGYTPESKIFAQKGILFPLRAKEYRKVVRFMQEQQAPFTPYGLYRRLPKTADAFCLTTEYLQVYTLIHRLNPRCAQRPTVLALCQESGWASLDTLCHDQRERGEWNAEKTQRFLIDTVHRGGRTAAYLLIVNSPQHALSDVDDRTVAAILDLLTVRTQEAVLCCQHLVQSTRPFSLREHARSFLESRS